MSAATLSRFPSVRDSAGLLVLAVIWGLSIPITKLGLTDVSPSVLTVMRFGLAVPFMFLGIWGRRPLPLAAMPKAAGVGVLGIGVGQAAQAIGIGLTSASLATMISAMIPVFVVFFAALRLRQPVSLRQMLGLACAFAGIVLVALEKDGGTQTSFWMNILGAGFVLLSTITIALYYVWSVELTSQHGTAVVASWSTLFGFLALLPWAASEWPHTTNHVTTQAVASATYLALAVTVAGLYLWLYLLKAVPARIAAGVQFLQPLIGVAAAAAIFGDHLGLMFAGGVALVLVGLALVVRPTG